MASTITLYGGPMFVRVECDIDDYVAVTIKGKRCIGVIDDFQGPCGVSVFFNDSSDHAAHGFYYVDFADIEPLTEEELEELG